MKRIILLTCLAVANVLAYHDPDLNYHLSQIQKLDGCDDRSGYSYRAPAVQLTTTGVKVAPRVITQQVLAAPAYQYSHAGYTSNTASSGYASGSAAAGYSSGVAYQAVAPKVTYASQPAVQYEAVVSHANYAAPYANQVRNEQKEVHGYATSAGLSAVASSSRTVTPQATYAQAPILAKITGAPLIARFAIAPAKTTYVTQNLAAQQQHSYATGSLAKASLNSYSTVQSGGPVVTQLYAAPAAAQYAASPALRVQQVQQQYITPARYTTISGPSTFYPQTGPISGLTPVANVASAYKGQVQYATSSVSQSSQYAAPTVTQYAAPVAQYAAPAVTQYAAPAAQYGAPAAQYGTPAAQYAAPAAQYGAPAVTQYTSQAFTQHTAPVQVQYAAPAVTKHYAQYSTPVITQHYAAPAVVKAAPVVTHYAAPAVSQYASSASGGHYAAHVHRVAPAIKHQHVTPAVTHITAPAVAHVATPLATIHAGHHSGHGKNVHKEFVENYDAHPRYAYEYAVNDPHTGDIKQQKEERDGEVVKGQYSLVEPDGSVRTVNYVADWETGFHADVRNSKDNQH